MAFCWLYAFDLDVVMIMRRLDWNPPFPFPAIWKRNTTENPLYDKKYLSKSNRPASKVILHLLYIKQLGRGALQINREVKYIRLWQCAENMLNNPNICTAHTGLQ